MSRMKEAETLLKKYYGYDKFRYPQNLIIDSVLNKKKIDTKTHQK